ncbi:hypothetical protein AVEN_183059-1, partial [Araneus ventricosus]
MVSASELEASRPRPCAEVPAYGLAQARFAIPLKICLV